MSHLIRNLTILTAIAVSCICCAVVRADEAKKTPPTKDQIAKWIRDLGDGEFDTRQAASKRLWEAGEAAESALKDALKSDDAEVVRRARELLDKFKWGIYPETPAKIVQLIGQYQGGNDEDNSKNEAILKLLDEGTAGGTALAKILGAEENQAHRDSLIEKISAEGSHLLPAMLVDADYAILESLLEQCALHDANRVYNYAAFCLLRGRLDDRIKFFKDKPKKDEPAQRVLTHLLRVKGDFAEARKLAEKDQDLLTRILVQQRDWKALAKLEPDNADDGPEKLVLLAAYNRLAGNSKEANKILDALRKRVEPNEDTPPDADADPTLQYVAKALLLNDRTKDAVELLKKGAKVDQHLEMLVAVLGAQQRGKEAFELLDKTPGAGPDSGHQLDLLRARLHLQFGEKDTAVKIFKELADNVKLDPNASWYGDMIEAEYQGGLRGLAQEHAVKMLSEQGASGREDPGLFGVFFPDHPATARIWWNELRGDPDLDRKIDAAALWKQLEAIMNGKSKNLPDQLDALSKKLQDLPEDQREAYYYALAYAAQVGDRKKDAQSYLEKACASESTPAEAFLKLGDFLAGEETWDKAAEAFQHGAEHYRTEAIFPYLQGWALTKASRADNGKKLIEMSHWVPLGDAEKRFLFAQELIRRGFTDDARRERELLLRIDDTSSRYTAEALRREAIDAMVKKDYMKAAEMSDASLLRVHQQSINFAVPASYFVVPQQAHRFRARGLLDKDKIDEALKEADYCLANYPGDIEVPILLTDLLEKKGRKKEADEIYSKVYGTMSKFCEQHPDSSWGQNTLAWLCAVCRRDLEDGLKHAKKANELVPDNAGYMDTLAEIYFQTGNKAKAMELTHKCIELEPKRAYFRKQLKRIEKGDTKVDVPEELADED